jgi:dihydroxy-acid dehydratase
MSGTAFGTVVLHIAPEAAAGGPLAAVRDGDTILLDAPNRTLSLEISDAELTARMAALPSHVPDPLLRRGYGWLYHEHVTQANHGCDFDFCAADWTT